MKRIITLTGLKQSGKYTLGVKWGLNENVDFIQPFTDNESFSDVMFYLSKDNLDDKISSEVVAGQTNVNGSRFIIFASQLVNDWNVVVADDYLLTDLLTNCSDVVTVWVDNPKAEASYRVNVIYTKDDFDYIYNYGLDDPDEFLEQLAFDVEMVQH